MVFSPLPASFIRITIAFLSLFLFTVLQGNLATIVRPILGNRNGGIKFAIAGTIFGPFLGMCLSLFTISNLDVSVGQTIFSLMPVSALLISMALYMEKITLRSFYGMMVAIGGVMILIWRLQISYLIFS